MAVSNQVEWYRMGLGCMSSTTEIQADLSDELLLRMFLDSADRTAFEKLVRRYEREIYTFLRRFLNDEQLAEDAFQATFLALYLRADQFEKWTSFSSWLYAIATNKAIDCQRRRRKFKVCSLDAEISNRNTEGSDTLSSSLVDDTPDPAFLLPFKRPALEFGKPLANSMPLPSNSSKWPSIRV